MTEKYDAIIIGTGQAGPSLAGRLVARRGADFGVMINGSIRIDMKKVMARKDEIVGKSTTGIENWLKNTKNVTVFEGHGHFEGPHTVRVDDHVLEADKIFINVGARPFVPHLKGIEAADYLTSSDMVQVGYVPDHLIVVGGSYTGLEFGQMFRRFGSQVTIVEKGPRLIARDDEDVSEAVREILESEGIDIRLDSECISVEQNGETIKVGLDCESSEKELSGSQLLLATGRTPNTEDLGVDKAGIKIGKHGYIEVDDELRTSVLGVWALGDCKAKGAFTHTAHNDFEIVTANLLDQGNRRVSDRIVAYALYIDPPLGRVGMTEAEVRASRRPALVAMRPMSLHLIVDTMYAKAPYTVIQGAVHIHPTVSEMVPATLGELKPLD
jgi:pyruvate/2-oxoglutarate dehydrogenase complex dihydrolipoamide dehydrogenase (E3) component